MTFRWTFAAFLATTLFGTALAAGAVAEEVAMKGELVCERTKPDANGRVTLDCAPGFRGDDERFYALRPSQEVWGKAMDSIGTRVLVKGTLVRAPNPGRDEPSGLITYRSIEPTYERRRITGTVVCLTHDWADTSPSDEECKPGLKSDLGLNWGLHPKSLEALGVTVKAGDRIVIEAEPVQDVPEDWVRSSWSNTPYPLEAYLRVWMLERLPPR